MFCNQCGKNVHENQKFCNHCGANLKNKDENLESNTEDAVINHFQVEKSGNETEVHFITTKRNLMILFSLIGYVCMLLPFTKRLDTNLSALETLGLSEYAFDGIVLAFLFFIIGSFYISRAKLKTAQILYAIGTVMVFAILQNHVETVLFSIEFGAWLIAIAGALVVFSGVIAKHLFNKPAVEPFRIPPIVTKIWVIAWVAIFAIIITSSAGTTIFSNKSLPNQ